MQRILAYLTQAEAEATRLENREFTLKLVDNALSESEVDATYFVEAYTNPSTSVTTHHVRVHPRLNQAALANPPVARADQYPSEQAADLVVQTLLSSRSALDDLLNEYVMAIMIPNAANPQSVNQSPGDILTVLKEMRHVIDAIKLGARHGAVDGLDELIDKDPVAEGWNANVTRYLSEAFLLPMRNKAAEGTRGAGGLFPRADRSPS